MYVEIKSARQNFSFETLEAFQSSVLLLPTIYPLLNLLLSQLLRLSVSTIGVGLLATAECPSTVEFPSLMGTLGPVSLEGACSDGARAPLP